MDDALAVMGGLQARQGRVLKDHSEWLQVHERAMERIEKNIAAQVAAGKATDERIDRLVTAIGEFMRRNGGERRDPHDKGRQEGSKTRRPY